MKQRWRKKQRSDELFLNVQDFVYGFYFTNSFIRIQNTKRCENVFFLCCCPEFGIGSGPEMGEHVCRCVYVSPCQRGSFVFRHPTYIRKRWWSSWFSSRTHKIEIEATVNEEHTYRTVALLIRKVYSFDFVRNIYLTIMILICGDWFHLEI